MLRWLRTRAPQPLAGAPAVRRQKSYAAQSGYVYHYFYNGHRPAACDGEPGQEYVFDVSTDRRTRFPVSVLVSDSAVSQRRLNATERYAVAKMALFQAFDERRDPGQMQEQVRVRPADLEAILAALGID